MKDNFYEDEEIQKDLNRKSLTSLRISDELIFESEGIKPEKDRREEFRSEKRIPLFLEILVTGLFLTRFYFELIIYNPKFPLLFQQILRIYFSFPEYITLLILISLNTFIITFYILLLVGIFLQLIQSERKMPQDEDSFQTFLTYLEKEDEDHLYHSHEKSVRLLRFRPHWPLEWSYRFIFDDQPPLNIKVSLLIFYGMSTCFSIFLGLLYLDRRRIDLFLIIFVLLLWPNVVGFCQLLRKTWRSIGEFRSFRNSLIQFQTRRQDFFVLHGRHRISILFEKQILRELKASHSIPRPTYLTKAANLEFLSNVSQ